MKDRTLHLVCSRCGQASPVPVHSVINVREHPELKEEVSSGRVFLWNCPVCGTPNLARYPFLYHDPDLRLLIWMSDGDRSVEEQMDRTVRGEEGLKDYTARMVDTPGDLIEKIMIFEAGLDDVAMEMCKYIVRGDIGKDVDLKFYSAGGADHELTFTYPENGQMQLVQAGFSVYEDCAGIVKRNPDIIKGADGLARIDRAWMEAFLR